MKEAVWHTVGHGNVRMWRIFSAEVPWGRGKLRWREHRVKSQEPSSGWDGPTTAAEKFLNSQRACFSIFCSCSYWMDFLALSSLPCSPSKDTTSYLSAEFTALEVGGQFLLNYRAECTPSATSTSLPLSWLGICELSDNNICLTRGLAQAWWSSEFSINVEVLQRWHNCRKMDWSLFLSALSVVPSSSGRIVGKDVRKDNTNVRGSRRSLAFSKMSFLENWQINKWWDQNWNPAVSLQSWW